MTQQDVKQMEERIAKFRQLSELQGRIRNAIRLLTCDDPNGPCGQGPFTGNTRESRQIRSLRIDFTVTRGGAPETSLYIPDMYVEAYEFSQFMAAQLNKQLDTVNEAIKNL